MLTVSHLDVSYPVAGGVFRAVKDVSFRVEAGAFFTLLGPSGCGKTTTLRSVAGLETPTAGRITIGNTPVFDGEAKLVMPPQRRDIGMVFQSYAVWPHMTVAENVGFPLEAQRTPAADARRRVEEALALVGLADYADRPATMLSGGQQQRVALARALVKGAALLLLDEPLSNLDAKLREQMRAELRDLQERLHQTTIYVTHDQEEALALSDRIAFMQHGRIVELGAPQELYLRPKHISTARFLGQAELLEARSVTANGAGAVAETSLGPLTIADTDGRDGDRIMIRPEQIEITDAESGPNTVAGQVEKVTFGGKIVEYRIAVAGLRLNVQSASTAFRTAGETVGLRLPPDKLVLLKEETTEDGPA